MSNGPTQLEYWDTSVGVTWDDGLTFWDGGVAQRWIEQPTQSAIWVEQDAATGTWIEQPDAQ